MTEPKPYLLGLIGSEASSAMSPKLWNPVFAALKNDLVYKPWDVAAAANLAAVRDRMLEPDVLAFNVTMPHKHWAADIADEADARVAESGAANLLVRAGNRLLAYNTDVEAIEEGLGEAHYERPLLLGAGGAGRAVLVALRHRAAGVAIADRDPDASRTLSLVAHELGLNPEVVDWASAAPLAAHADLVINATPVGKHAGDGPVWGDGVLRADARLYDFVYADHVTGNVESARHSGTDYVDGWHHLLLQAVAMIPILKLPARTRELLAAQIEVLRSGFA